MELMKRTAYILALAAAVACNDIVTYKRDLPERFVHQGAPAISAIYDIRDDKMDIPLSGGTLAQTLHIKGENLSNPVSITFNGLEADLEKCYCENKDSYVLIPRVIPEKVDNKLVYTTAEGSVTYEFPVTIPELSLVGLADEFALPGNSVQVVGDFFDLFGFGGEDPKATISIGNTPIQVDSLSETYMSVYIPEDTPDCSLLTFSWNDINLGPQMRSIPFRNTRWLLFGDFGTTLYWGNVNSKKVLTDKGAEIVNEEAWGLKKMAYAIQKKSTGFYFLMEFKAEPEVIKTLETAFRRDEKVIRFQTVKFDKYAAEYAEKRRNKFGKKEEA